MPITYEQLTRDQKCIYQAFENVYGVTDTGSQMGAYVNSQGIDADDDKAVRTLAKRYGLTNIEMFSSADWNSGEYNLEKNYEYVLSVTSLVSMVTAFEDLRRDWVVVKGEQTIAPFQDRFTRAIGHTLYCKTKTTLHVIDVWTDVQRIYSQPPNFSSGMKSVVVAYDRPRVH